MLFFLRSTCGCFIVMTLYLILIILVKIIKIIFKKFYFNCCNYKIFYATKC